METDVSSTTGDVPEVREVTGSHDIETVVVIEKLEHEEQNDEPSSEVIEQMSNKTTEKDVKNDYSKENCSPSKSLEEKQEVNGALNKTPTVDLPQDVVIESTLPKNDLKASIVESSFKIVHIEESVDSTNKLEDIQSKANSTEMTIPFVSIEENICDKNSTQVKETFTQHAVDALDISTLVENHSDVNGSKLNEPSSSSVQIEKVISNDSQIETNSENSDKDHNKSISRELKSLIKSAKDSKIISEYTQVISKVRKSRTGQETSNSSLNSPVEADKVQASRRNSNNSQIKTNIEISNPAKKRSMRSQNPEFVYKSKQFLDSITGKRNRSKSEGSQGDLSISDDEVVDILTLEKKKDQKVYSNASLSKKKKIEKPVKVQQKLLGTNKDIYCWRCHWVVEPVVNEKMSDSPSCSICPRTYHQQCLSSVERSKLLEASTWMCPDCTSILQAESTITRSPKMKKTSLGMLCELLKYALDRMMEVNGVEPFMSPMDHTLIPEFDTHVIHPIDLTIIKEKIDRSVYGSTETFLADVQWILHNTLIINSLVPDTYSLTASKLVSTARMLLRSCRAQMSDIEVCPECYAGAHARKDTWFTDVCSTPHILLWAKLKGFPYWPAKAMCVNSSGLVDVRFFGQHDRAWVPAKDCFLYSEKDPNNASKTKRRQDIIDSMQEAEQHIRNISRKYDKFVYPPFKMQFDPTKLQEQLKLMIPSFEGEVTGVVKEKHASRKLKRKSRSSSVTEGNVNETGDKSSFSTSQMRDESKTPVASDIDGSKQFVTNGARDQGDISFNKEITDINNEKVTNIPKQNCDKMVEENMLSKENGNTNKRRRSEMEEAVITVLEETQTSKRKRSSPNTGDSNKLISKNTTSDSGMLQTPGSSFSVKQVETKKCVAPKTATKSSTPKIAPLKIVLVNKNKISNKSHKDSKKQQKNTTNTNKRVVVKTYLPDENPTVKRWSIVQKPEKRRSSKSNKSSTNSDLDKSLKDVSSIMETESTPLRSKVKDTEQSLVAGRDTSTPKSKSKNVASLKDKMFDDNTCLAVIAKKVCTGNVVQSVPGLPTISNVRSLNTTESNSTIFNTNKKNNDEPIEVDSNSRVITSSTKKNISAGSKQKQKVGLVEVKAFARMSPSPEREKQNKLVEIEIKSEVVDLDDADRHTEKMNLMHAFQLRPVQHNNTQSLRDVRITKVTSGPLCSDVPVTATNNSPQPNKEASDSCLNKSNGNKTESRNVARKGFIPSPKKNEDSHSELNGKNSMVYIPIQPPITDAPVRSPKIVATNNAPSSSVPRLQSPVVSSGNTVNTVTTPLVPTTTHSSITPSLPTTTSSSSSVHTVGPTSVHTLPLIASVNGQWTLSLQPIMSVGGLDTSNSSPCQPAVNGFPERSPVMSGNQQMMTVMSPPMAGKPLPPVVQPELSGLQQQAILPSSSNINTRTVTDKRSPGELPRLQQKPLLLNPLDPQTPVGPVPPPSTAGPITAKLNQNAVKMTEYFRTLLEDSLEKIDEPSSQVVSLKRQLENTQWRHSQEIKELKHNHELTIAEMRATFDKEKIRALSEYRRSAQNEIEAAVKHTKSKQWCANCFQEAQFYCCWNTSYCDYPCQKAHWTQHFSVCTQQRAQNSNNSLDSNIPLVPPEMRLQPQPVHLQKPTSSKQITGENSLQNKTPQKSSIIVSVVDDNGGNQTLKCLGTYTSPTKVAPPTGQSLLINQQVSTNEVNSAKKVVPQSGRYFIVEAAGMH